MECAGKGEGARVGSFADVGEGRGEQVDGAADGVDVFKFGLHADDVAVDVLVFRVEQPGVFEQLELLLGVVAAVMGGHAGECVDDGAMCGFAGAVEPEG